MVSLSTKLGLKPVGRVCIWRPPPESAHAAQAIREACPAGVKLFDEPDEGSFDQIFFWPTSTTGLPELFARLQQLIYPDGAVWAVLPKQKYARARGLAISWQAMQEAGLTTDLVDNKNASINEEEYGTRFVIRKDRR